MLTEEFQKMVKEDNVGTESEEIEMYNTGIDLFDYANGMYRPDGTLGLGIPAGRIQMLIGNSGTAKTSIAIQQATNIVENYEGGTVFHYDFERSTSKERIRQLSGWTNEQFNEKYFHFTRDISSESIFKIVKSIEKVKVKNRKKLEVDTGRVDDYGEPVMELPPTVILIDSIAVMAPQEIEEDDELVGNMGEL